MTTFKYLFAGL